MKAYLVGLFVALTAAACGRSPCENEGASPGPVARIDVALGTCNFHPIIQVTADEQVPRGGTAMIDASTSFDPNGDPLTFQFTLVGVPEGSLAQVELMGEGRIRFSTDRVGEYRVNLVVSDGELKAEENLTVLVSNSAPIANVGSHVSVDPGDTVFLDGSQSSDPNGDPITYRWAITAAPEGTQASIADASAITTQLTTDIAGRYEVTLTVNDGELEASATLLVSAGVPSVPPIPVIRSLRSSVMVGDIVDMDGSQSSHPEGYPFTFMWSFAEAPALSRASIADPLAEEMAFVPDQPGIYRVQLVVTDGYNTSGPAFVEVRATGSANPNPIGLFPGTSVLDPARVYMHGTLSEGACYLDAICDLFTPNAPSAGFGCYDSSSFSIIKARIRPTDGAYLYLSPGPGGLGEKLIRRFVADRLGSETENGVTRWIYPSDPYANDQVLPTPNCANVGDFVIHPSTGKIIYSCQNARDVWFDENGAEVETCGEWVLAMGLDGSMLCSAGSQDVAAVLDPNGQLHTFAPSAERGTNIVRVRPEGGYWHLRAEAGKLQRWILENDGTARLDVEFGAPPFETDVLALLNRGLFDGVGDFYVLSGDPSQSFIDVVFRFSPNVPGMVAYTELEDPHCKLHGSSIFSGP